MPPTCCRTFLPHFFAVPIQIRCISQYKDFLGTDEQREFLSKELESTSRVVEVLNLVVHEFIVQLYPHCMSHTRTTLSVSIAFN